MRKLYKRMSLALLLWVTCVSLTLAQGRTVTGTVTDEAGSSMPGVNVLIKGTGTGTSTDADGKFNIGVPDDNAVLVFTFVGYASTEVVVGSRTVVDVQLNPDVQTLTELVVTGYTEQRKKDITGAVSVVDVDALQNVQASSISQKLDGRASGVTISTSGEPGEGSNVRIRGLGSFRNDGGANDPLWVVDGVQLDGRNNNWLNPADVESIQVLKDASAASIYGVGAANGVIIVTTKRGKAGKTKVSYNGYVGTQSPVKGYNDFMILNPYDMAEAYTRYTANITPDFFYYGYSQDGSLPDYTWPLGNLDTDGNTIINYNGDPETTLDAYNYPNNLIMGSNLQGTDWWDEVFDPAIITDHTLNVSGGTENSSFNFSTGYMKNNGTMIHTGFERFTLRANSTFKAGKFSFGENATFSRTERIAQFGANQDNQNAITGILLSHPVQPIYDIGGNFAGPKYYSNGPNVVAQQIRGKDNKGISFNFVGSAFAAFEVTEWLKLKTLVGADFWNGVTKTFNYPSFERREPTTVNSFNENWQQNFTWQWSNTAEINKTIGSDHQINGLLGYEAREGRWQEIRGSLSNYFSEAPDGWYLNAGLADPNTRVVSSNGAPWTRVSMFAKVDYTLKDKYLFSATIRRDGSSRFGGNKRWGNFPAASIGWRISSEQFMSSVTAITDLKLRVGYGETGNDNLPSQRVFDQYGGGVGSSFYAIGGGNSVLTGYNLTQRGNPDLGWETNKTTNIGIDLSLLGGKVNVVVDVYKRQISDLLFAPSVAGTAGSAAPPVQNIGEMENRGIDISLGWKGNITPDLQFTTDLNITHYKNEITQISDELEYFNSGGADGFSDYVRNYIGSPMASFYGFTYLGPIRSDEEAAALPPNTIAGANFAGGWKFKDLDGNNSINGEDRSIIGNPHPDVVLGLNLGLNYKNFDFSMFLFSSIGNDIFNYQRYYYETGRWGSGFSKRMLTDTWTVDNPNAPLPALTENNNAAAGVASSYYIEDGSFLRARTLTLGYTFPATALSKVGMDNCRVYVQAQNLFTITGYSGIDPEISNYDIGDGNANSQYLGTDLGSYPSSRIFSVGVSLGF
jgi:TonB-linked SusC/RagA family outer membrane protein